MSLKAFSRARARELGFHAVGFARAEPLPREVEGLRAWLDQGCHAEMGYLERWIDVRGDPAHPGMLAGARTVMVLAMAYPWRGPEPVGLAGYLARYARGPDYHRVVRGRLKALLAELRAREPGLRGRALVDTAPIFERAWAARAGLGWIGRNTCLIHPELGSALVLGELVLSVELEPDPMIPDRCGDCRACVEACPTGALRRPEGRWLDARRCLSYWSVEARGPIPPDLPAEAVLFGCDACGAACPWNQRPREPESALASLERWRGVTLEELARMELALIEELIRGTALERAGAEKLRERARKVGLGKA